MDLLKTNHDVKIVHYFNAPSSLGCSQIIAHPTRITPSSCTLFYHIYTNNFSQHIISHAIISDISDHLPVTAFGLKFQTVEYSL